MIGTFPCGLIPMIDELFVTENIEQVYALVILKPFSEKAKQADRNQVKKNLPRQTRQWKSFTFLVMSQRNTMKPVTL